MNKFKAHILVVDDDDGIRTLVKQYLNENKFLVTTAISAEDAIQKMLNNNIRRLLILDNERLVGVITQTDLASYLRDQILVDGTIKSIGEN